MSGFLSSVPSLCGGAGGAGAEAPRSVRASAAALVTTSLQRAQDALSDVLRAVAEYDAKHTGGAATKATEYLDGAFKKTKAALSEVAAQAAEIRKKPLAELPSAAVATALEHASEALQQLKERARAYDNEIGVSAKVTDSLSAAQAAATSAVADARAQLTTATEAATARAASVTDAALRQMLTLDARFGVSDVATRAASSVAGHARGLDERFGVSASVGALDEKLGGYGAAALARATELVDGAVGAVAGRIEEARGAEEKGTPALADGAAGEGKAAADE